MGYYTDCQYSEEISPRAKKDLRILFFNSFLKNSSRILDIGCSLGRIISLDSKRIQGIDIDKKALKIAKSKGFQVQYADISKKLPFKEGSFDAVFCSQVIEHLQDPLYAMQEIERCLEKKGRVVLITPDYMIASKSKKNNFWEDYTHIRPLISESLERLAYDAGFKKFRVYHFPGKGFRTLMRIGFLSKEIWIKLEKLPFVWKGQDIILEATKE